MQGAPFIPDCIMYTCSQKPKFLSSKIICIISIPGQDSCSGDSGGPLVWREYSDDPWYQIGVVSFGAVKCGSKDIPGVYTRVEAYLSWIESNLEA